MYLLLLALLSGRCGGVLLMGLLAACAGGVLCDLGVGAEESWLLMVEAGRGDAEDRRITPKSVFIAPSFSGMRHNQHCKDGQRLNHRGECVKVFRVKPTPHLDSLLHQLQANRQPSLFFPKREPASAGPLHVPLPLLPSLVKPVVNKEVAPSTNTSTLPEESNSPNKTLENNLYSLQNGSLSLTSSESSHITSSVSSTSSFLSSSTTTTVAPPSPPPPVSDDLLNILWHRVVSNPAARLETQPQSLPNVIPQLPIRPLPVSSVSSSDKDNQQQTQHLRPLEAFLRTVQYGHPRLPLPKSQILSVPDLFTAESSGDSALPLSEGSGDGSTTTISVPQLDENTPNESSIDHVHQLSVRDNNVHIKNSTEEQGIVEVNDTSPPSSDVNTTQPSLDEAENVTTTEVAETTTEEIEVGTSTTTEQPEETTKFRFSEELPSTFPDGEVSFGASTLGAVIGDTTTIDIVKDGDAEWFPFEEEILLNNPKSEDTASTIVVESSSSSENSPLLLFNPYLTDLQKNSG